MGNGIVVGSLIGLAGREGDITLAHRNAMYWLSGFAMLQFGLVFAIYSLLRIGDDATALERSIARGIVALLLSIPSTILAGTVAFGVLRSVRLLSR